MTNCRLGKCIEHKYSRRTLIASLGSDNVGLNLREYMMDMGKGKWTNE